jgi:hypothetical protein
MGLSKKTTTPFNNLPLILFGFSIFTLVFSYGFSVARFGIFPYSYLKSAIQVGKEFVNKVEDKHPWYYPKTTHTQNLQVYNRDKADTGLILFSSIGEDNGIFVKIIDRDGQIIHKWDLDWFTIWPDPEHLTEKEKPKSRPGTNIHGMVLMENGDLIFNYEYLGLVRLDVCGNIVWKLPYRTHHSIWRDENDILWVPGLKHIEDTLYKYPNFNPPVELNTILKVSLDGEVLDEIDLVDLFENNNLQGLLYVSTNKNWTDIKVTGDIFHLNDIEVFPRSMEEGLFKAGDIMISLCNMNAVIVFNGDDLSLRYMTIGGMIRQHDPDFLDGNTISIFDNNNGFAKDHKHRSRILIVEADNDKFHVTYEGDEENPFYSLALGSHQRLPNANLLITETLTGRIFEVDTTGNIVWEFINIVDEGYAGEVEEAKRLPERFTSLFFEQRLKECIDKK